MPYIIPGLGNTGFDPQGNLTGVGGISATCFRPYVSNCSLLLNQPIEGEPLTASTPFPSSCGLLGNYQGALLTESQVASDPVVVTPSIPSGYHVVQQTLASGFPSPNCFLVQDS